MHLGGLSVTEFFCHSLLIQSVLFNTKYVCYVPIIGKI